MGYIQCRNIKLYTFVDSRINLISNPINIMGKDDEYRLTGGVLKPLDIIDRNKIEIDIKYETENELRKIKNLSNYCDKDFKLYISLHYDYYINERIKKGVFKKVFSLIEVFFQGVSIDYLLFNLSVFQHIEQLKDQLKNGFFNNVIDYKVGLPLVFTSHAAVVFAHEFLGHMFEIDNYHFYNYKEVITNIEALKLTVLDDPLIMNTSAYYNYDDAGIEAKITTIFDKGCFTGQLIGGDIDKMLVKSSLRRDTYASKLQPRMSNLIVEAECLEKRPKRFIEVRKLSKCFVDHKNKVVILYVELALLRDNSMTLFRLKPFSLEISVFDLVTKIHPIENCGFLRPLQCFKKGQVIECGGISCDWLLINT